MEYMTRRIVSLLVVGLLTVTAVLLPGSLRAADEPLPLPRFVSLKSEEVNMRTGPGIRYPIKWVYLRQGLPVEVIDEFEQWRKVRDQLGETGWIHRSLLSGRRMALVMNEDTVFYYSPEPDAAPIFRAGRDKLGQVLECEGEWCRLQVEGMKGWVKRYLLYGVYEDEDFD